jgi:hypothetical protein
MATYNEGKPFQQEKDIKQEYVKQENAKQEEQTVTSNSEARMVDELRKFLKSDDPDLKKFLDIVNNSNSYYEVAAIGKWLIDIAEIMSLYPVNLSITQVLNKQKIRQMVWQWFFGINVTQAICPMCDVEIVNLLSSNWDAAHIIPDKVGGPLIVPNLRPVCKSCNAMSKTKGLYLVCRFFPGAAKRLRLPQIQSIIPPNDVSYTDPIDVLAVRGKLLENDHLHTKLDEIINKYLRASSEWTEQYLMAIDDPNAEPIFVRFY